jgi:iron complex transport system permease protein
MKISNKTLIFLFLLFILTVFLGLSQGSVSIPFTELFSENNKLIFYLRLLRVLLCIIAGSGLAVAGIVLQAILRNPLAEPYLLGTSSGAGLGAVIAVLAGISGMYLPLAAFIGALFSVTLVYAFARQQRTLPAPSLILSGVIVSIAFSGITVFLIYLSPNEALHGLMWWLWGSTQVLDMHLLLLVAIVVVGCIICVATLSQDLNAISIGEEEAHHLGIDVEVIKRILIVLTAIITAALVCICGTIGFVGLIIPHMTRLLFGPNHRTLIPASCLVASIFMIACDCISRVAIPFTEVPIGIITSIIGAPVFIALLRRNQRER